MTIVIIYLSNMEHSITEHNFGFVACICLANDNSLLLTQSFCFYSCFSFDVVKSYN